MVLLSSWLDMAILTLQQTHKNLPAQFVRSSTSLWANIVIASFGSSTGYDALVFPLKVELDTSAPASASEKPMRYGKLPEIHHIFRQDPKSPNIVIVLFFTAAALTTLPILLGAVCAPLPLEGRLRLICTQWLFFGANFAHLQKALADAPTSHALFFGSIVGIEVIFFLYYTSWNLFQTLPALTAVGTVAFVSGSRALTEVQERRLAGHR